MTFEEAMAVYGRKRPLGMLFGTARLDAALRAAGVSITGIPTVHVAGTNGKGSVAAMIAAMGQAAGLRVGVFTSPSLGGICDDITVGGVAVGEADFAAATARVLAGENPAAPLSFFELETGAALAYFAAKKPDFCVIECGLGGRDDATNVIPPPTVAVITAVSLDHTALLGKTVAEIAAAKCGILKAKTVAVTSPHQHPDALEVICRAAAENGAVLEIPAAETVTKVGRREVRFTLGGRTYTVAGGRHQAANAAVALTAAGVLARLFPALTEDAMAAGLAAARFPCRLEWLSDRPVRLMDGGHNPAAAAALARSLDAWGVRGAVLFTGMMADKDAAAYVQTIAPYCRQVICTRPPNPRAMDPAALAALYREQGIAAETADDPTVAATRAVALSGDDPLLIAGSFYLCAAVRHLFRK